MKTLLLASAAALSLAIATPAFAQTTQPLPATPPAVQPTPDPEVSEDQQPDLQAPAPVVEGPTAPWPEVEASATVEPPSVAAQASVAGESQSPQTEAEALDAAPPLQVVQATAPNAAAPDAPASQTMTETAAAPTQAATVDDTEASAMEGATPAFTTAAAVCQPRTTSVHFGRSNTLSRQNQNAIEHALDSASVCDIQAITIADSGAGQRRAEAVRATLVRQGVPEERITIARSEANAAGAATGQLDVQMQLAGVTSQAELQPTATTGRNAAASPNMMVAEAAPQRTQLPNTPPPQAEEGPAPLPETPEATPPAEPEDESAET